MIHRTMTILADRRRLAVGGLRRRALGWWGVGSHPCEFAADRSKSVPDRTALEQRRDTNLDEVKPNTVQKEYPEVRGAEPNRGRKDVGGWDREHGVGLARADRRLNREAPPPESFV